jgi:hypothetical protein
MLRAVGVVTVFAPFQHHSIRFLSTKGLRWVLKSPGPRHLMDSSCRSRVRVCSVGTYSASEERTLHKHTLRHPGVKVPLCALGRTCATTSFTGLHLSNSRCIHELLLGATCECTTEVYTR